MATQPLPAVKRGKKPVIFVLMALLVVAGGAAIIHLYLQALESDGTRITFGTPGVAALTSTPLSVQTSPELAAEGVACKGLATSADAQAVFFLHKERHAARVELTTTGADLDLSGLSYTLYDGNDLKVGGGRLHLSGQLKAGDSREAEIADYELSLARRVVIGR
jgi:hypothetical protein